MADCIKRRCKIEIEGPNDVEQVYLEEESFSVTKSGGKFKGTHRIELCPKRIIMDVHWMGTIGTKTKVDLTINGTTKTRKPRIKREEEKKTFRYTFEDFDLPESDD